METVTLRIREPISRNPRISQVSLDYVVSETGRHRNSRGFFPAEILEVRGYPIDRWSRSPSGYFYQKQIREAFTEATGYAPVYLKEAIDVAHEYPGVRK